MKPVRKDPQDFAMLTRGYMKEIRELAKRAPAAFQIFMLLAERMNKTNAVVISWSTMSQILGISRATVYRAIALLETEQWVQVVKVGSANGYLINSKVVWRNHSGKRYGSFFAEVVIGEDEQGKPIEDWDNIELRNIPIISKNDLIIDDGSDLPPPDQKDLFPPLIEEIPHFKE